MAVTNITSQLVSNQDIVLSGATVASLPSGKTVYTGKLSGSGTIALTSASDGGGTLISGAQTFILPSPNETETLSYANGAWSVDITAAILANKDITLTTNATVSLPAGLTTYTGKISGAGVITVNGSTSGPSTLTFAQSNETVTLTAAGQSMPATLSSSGAWSVDLSSAFSHNQDIVLDGNATLTIANNGVTTYTGKITGNGTIILVDTSGANATLDLGGNIYVNLARGNTGNSETLTLNNGVWTADVTGALLNNNNIGLTIPTTIELPSGTTTYKGNLFVDSSIQNNAAGTPVTSATLTLTSGAGGSTLVIDGRTIVLPDSNQTETFLITSGGSWTGDLTTALLANHNINLSGMANTVSLPAGTTVYTGTITGPGTIALNASGTGGGSLTIGSRTITLPSSGETETLTLSAAGAWSVDVSAAINANKSITLTGVTATATLAAGTTTYTGTIGGTGTLILTSAGTTGGSTLVVGGQTFVLSAANETETLSLANGVWSADITAAVLARQAVTLTGRATLALPAGATSGPATISGAGSLTISTGSAGGATLSIGGVPTFALPDANQTETATLSGGVWTIDVSASVLAGQDITLLPAAASMLSIPAGTTTYAGHINGSGQLRVSSGGAGGSTLVLADGTTVVLPDANETETLVRAAAGTWTVDVSAAIAASQDLVLNGTPATAILAAGVTQFKGNVTGTGSLTLASSATGGGTLVLKDGTTFTLPDANETETATLANGAWSVDVTQAMTANQDIVLSSAVPLVVHLPQGAFSGAGSLNYTGKISGSGQLIVYTKDSVLTLPGGYTVNLGYGANAPLQQVTLTYANGSWSTDFTHEVLANHRIILSGAATVELPSGTTVHTAGLSGSGTLTMTSGSTGGSRLELDGTTFVVPSPNQTLTATLGTGGWVVDYTAAIMGNINIALTTQATVHLRQAGVTDYKGQITGGNSITVTSSATGGSTLVIDGKVAGASVDPLTLVLPDANETQTVTLKNGVWTTDVTAAILANQDIALTTNATVELPAGITTYTGKISGNATLTVTVNPASPGTLVFANQTLTGSLASNGLSGGTLVVDVTQPMEANANIVLTPSMALTLTLPTGGFTGAGILNYTGTISGSGHLIVNTHDSILTLPGGYSVNLGYGDQAPMQQVILTLANGSWSTDFTHEILANHRIVLSGAATIELPAGVTTYTANFSGSGPLTVSAATGGSTLVIDGQAITLPDANQTETFTVTNGVLGIDLTNLLAANTDITLTGVVSIATLKAGTTQYTGTINGAGGITLTAGSSASTLVLKDGTTFTLAAGASETAILSPTGWHADATAALLANKAITLGVATSLTLPAGTTTYTGTISGAAPLTLTSANVTGGSTLVAGGHTFTLPSPNETETATFANGVWTTDVGAALAANQNIVLGGGNTIATLAPGSTTYYGTISGTGTLTLTASAGGGSTVTLHNNGATFVLPTAGEIETATLSSSGTWSVDVSAALQAGQNITLTTNATATLPAGTTTYQGTLSGTGVLTVAASAYPATLTIPGVSNVVLTAADPTETISLVNGGATVDVGAALAANQAIVLNGATTATLKAGTTTYTGTISGSGTLVLTSASGGGTLVIGAKSFVLPASGETETLTLTNGVWSTDIGAAINANQAVTLTGPTTIALHAGTTNYTGTLAGSGTITFTAPSNTTSTLVLDGTALSLSSAGESQTVTIVNGAVGSVDVTAALLANQNIYLSVPTIARLPAGTTAFTGTLNGSAPFTLTSGGSGGATLTLANGTSFTLPDANESETFTFVNNAWTANATSAFLAGQDIALNQPTTINLPNGATTYAGTITGTAALTLVSGGTGSSTTIGGQTFVLPAGGESETLTLTNGVWTADIGAAIRANQAITLTGPTTVALGGGTTTYTGALGGSGTILFTTPANSSASIVFSGSGTTLSLPAGGYSEVATISNGVVTSVDVTKALLANQNIALSVPATILLPTGTTTYTGSISGNGTLKVTSGATGGSTLAIGAQTFVLPMANETETLSLANGVWSTDVSAAILANQNIVLTGNATATVPAGTTNYTGTVSGQGILAVTGGASAASTVNLGGATTFTVGAGQTVRETLNNGQWAQDITAQILANQNIVLSGAAAVYLTANVNYTGTITGQGSLVVTAPTTGGATLALNNKALVNIPTRGQTETVTLANGVWTQDVTAQILANQSVTLTVPTTLSLPAGVTRYTGSIGGNGTLTIASGASGGATLELSGGRTFVLPAANDSVTLVQSNGVWTSNISTPLAANEAITLTGAATATLAAGTTTYTGTIDGTGRLTLTAPSTGASVLVLNGSSLSIPAGQSTTITLVKGVIATDVGSTIAASQAITLSGPTAALLAAGTTTYTGTISGSGTLTLTGANSSAGSTLVIGGQTFTLASANEVETLTLAGGVWTTDLSEAVENNQAVVLNGAASVQLLAGTETDRAAITGTGSITLTAANVAGGGTLVAGGHTFVLGAAGEVETATLSGGVWTTDVTAAILANQPITLSGANTAKLPVGTTTYTGAITGAGTLTLTASSAGPGTLVIGGQAFPLLAATETETLTLSASGTWSVDASTALAAGQPIALSAIPTTATLAAGTTTYAGVFSGAGTLAITSSATGASTLVIGSQSFVLPAAGETETLTRSASGTWSVDVTAAVLANKDLALTGVPTVLTVPTNGISYKGTLSGNGTIVVSSGAAGASVNLGGATSVYLPVANETNSLTVTNGVVTSVDVTAAILANLAINVSINATATLPAGTTTFGATLGINSGSSLTLTSGAGPASLVLANGTTFVLPNAGETETFLYTTGIGWTADATAAAVAGHDIVLNQPTTITLTGGTTQAGTITGTAPLTLISGSKGGALRLADGTVFTLPGANETETVSLANGMWTTNVSAALAANLAITLSGTTVATLASGTTTYTAAINGSGTLKLTSANVAGGSTLVIGGQSFALPSPNETETLTLAGGVWHVDVTTAINNRQSIVLNGAETVELNAGNTYTPASISGTGSLVVTGGTAGASSLQLGSSYISLPDAGETVTLTQTATGWSEDITAAVLANHAITLSTSTPATLTLPAGTTTYTGTINGTGTLMVTSSGTGGGVLIIGSQTFQLPSAGESEILTLTNGAWSTDVSAAIAANKAIVLNGAMTTATLNAGTTAYTGAISGTGSIVLTSSGTGDGTLTLADGTRFVLPSAGETATAILSNGHWSLDVGAAILANKAITLAGSAVASLPAGTTTYTGTISGTGTLTLTSSATSTSTFVVGSRTITLAAAKENETLVFVNGVWTTTDITAAVTANQNVVLNGASTLILPSGALVDTSSITGSGALTLTTGAAGGSLTLGNGTSFVLPDAGETETATLVNGVWTTDVSAAIAAGHDIAVSGHTIATLGAGTTSITSLTGTGTVTLTSSSVGGATLASADGKSITIAGANQSVVVSLVNGVASIDVTAQIAGNQTIALGTNATAFLAAGHSSFSASISGSGTLTLFGATTGDSTITLAGTTYTVPANTALALTETNGVFAPAATTDISAAIAANQQSIVFIGGKYVIDVPKGQTYAYTGVMSGIGTLDVTGGGTLLLENNSTFTLPSNQQNETVTQDAVKEIHYDGIDLGYNSSSAVILHGQNAPVVTIDKGTTLDLGDPSAVNQSYGNISSLLSGFGASYNVDNIQVNGTLTVSYYGGAGYDEPLGELSGDGVVMNDQGSVGAYGTSSFTGTGHFSGFNIGGGHGNGSLAGMATIDNGFVLTFGGTTATTNGSSSGIDLVPTTIYEQHFGASIHDLGVALDEFTGRYIYNDSGSLTNPSLSDERLNYMTLSGNASNKLYYTGSLQQFGDGTNANFFLPGNETNSAIEINGNGTLGFDYNGTVAVDAPIVYGITNQLNLVIIGTTGNHIILTQAEQANGFTQIDQNAILQLGDGTKGNGSVITVSGKTGVYSTSNGNGSLMTAESAGGAAADTIIDNGQLIVDNVDGARDGITPITLSHISGTGSLLQEGTQRVTLLEDTTYTGETDIANGTLALADTSGWTSIASSSGVVLRNAGAVFDISQAGDQEIEALTGAAGSTVALGGGILTVAAAGTTLFAGALTDGGIGGGAGGGLAKTDAGTLELSGDSTYTGLTDVEAGTLQLDGISLASSQIKVAAGALLTGSGTLSGAVLDNGEIAASGGTLSLGAVTGTGKLDIGAGASLVLSSATSQAITFEGAGMIVLGQAASYSGAISGFGSTDSIDLAGLTATSVVYSSGAGVLYVMNGSSDVAQLHVGAVAAGSTFAVSADGQGGSLITETTAPAQARAQAVAVSSNLILTMSEDAYNGDAQFTVTVNGVKQSGVYTVTALHGQGQTQTFAIPGSFGTGVLNVGISFVNDAKGSASGQDRNLYIDTITDYGVTQSIGALLEGNGTRNVMVDGSTTYTIGAADQIALQLSEDAYQGDAQFTVSVDGVQQGGTRTVTTLHSSGQTQEFDVTGDFGNGSHTVTVNFLNDKYAGTASTDRNVYVKSITYDGQTTVENAAQLRGGAHAYGGIGLGVDNIAATNTTLTSTGADTINAGSGTSTLTLAGPSATVNGGTGTDTIAANGNDTILANGAAMTVTGGTGTMTFIGGTSLGTVAAGSGAASVTAGSGGLTFTAGSGTATVTAGSGADLITLVNGSAGGATIINAFTQGVDHIALKGYDATAVSQAIDQATVSGGALTVALPDHSTIAFKGLTSIDHGSFQTA